MKKEVLFLSFLIIFISFASASFDIGNKSYSIEKEYSSNGTLSGWVNISFDSESSESLIKDNFGNSISLLDLLKKNSSLQYNCSTKNCSKSYDAGIPDVQKSFTLSSGSSKLVGLKITGDINKINAIKFDLTSTAQSSCDNQVKIDFFEDGIYDYGNTKTSSNVCSENKNYSCFNESLAMENYALGSTLYCQKISLNEAPGFRVGAWIKKTGSGTSDLVMFIHDGPNQVATCKLPDATTLGGEVSCDLNYLVTQTKDYYVCAYSKSPGIYTLRGNANSPTKCGFYGLPVKPFSTAYQIFAQKKEFGSVGTITINDSLPSGKALSTIMESYIINKYKTMNCEDGCVIPIKITSQANQSMVLKNLILSYEKSSGSVLSENFYDIQESSTKISSNFQKISLDNAGFNMPNKYGNYTLDLKLNDEIIFSDKISVVKIPLIRDFFPKTVPIATPMEFRLEVDFQNVTVSEYDWEFDGSLQITATNKINHTFNTGGNHKVKVTIKSQGNKSSSKTFDISVYIPQEKIGESISILESDLTRVKKQIGDLPSSIQNLVRQKLGISNIESSIVEIKKKYTTATTDPDYVEITRLISLINMPESISTSKNATNIVFYPKKNVINLNILESITDESRIVGKDEKYKDAILSWELQNLDMKINFKEITARQNGQDIVLISFYDILIGEKQSLGENVYLIIKNMSDFKFEKSYSERVQDDYYYIEMSPSQEKISFSTSEKIEFSDLPAFVSPGINALGVKEEIIIDIPKNSKGGTFILIAILLIVAALIGYIFLYRWYKYKYENHLFKNKNNLYNITSYIGNSKRKGMTNDQIIEKLGNTGWSGEQIKYAMKKYEGKNTGLWWPSFGKKKEVEKKSSGYNFGTGLNPRSKIFGDRLNSRSKSFENEKYNTLAIVAFIFMFVFSPVGLILGIIALSQIKKTREKGRWMALTSIIIPIAIIIIGILLLLIYL